ncbi:MAG TPA: NAD(+)/NADH kinase [Candidatus Bathyarchaeia archaeon]
MFKSVGLVARYDNTHALKLAEELCEYLRSQKVEVYAEETLDGRADLRAEFIPLRLMKPDFLITIGGDGTILRTCIEVPKPEPPILAVNKGVRGFLTEVEPKDACAAAERCLKGDYRIERCCKLAISTEGETIPDGLNDVVVSAGEPSKLLYTQIIKDKEPILRCQSDGLIVATQTGSTGYSLSAGGPVLDVGVDAFVLTPICSLTVFRSLVFPAETKVTIKAIRPKDTLVLVDGRYRLRLKSENAIITITRSKNFTSFIRFKDDFYGRLRNRLLFKGMG